MTYDELMRTIRETTADQWLHHDAEGVHTYRHDLNIRIERVASHRDADQFNEEWATRHPDPNSRREEYAIYYGGSLVDTFTLVSVDGGRASLPMPEIRTQVVFVEDYRLARIVDNGKLDEYIKRSGLRVEP